MEALMSSNAWGSPVGLGIFLFLMAVGGGVFFWGMARLNDSKKQD